MTDTAESRMLLRLQSTGSNTNLWGGYLNDNLEIIGRGAKGYEAIAMTGDTTLNWTNYSKVNSGEVGTIKLTGSLSAAAAFIVGSREYNWVIWNTTGQTVTARTAAGVGVAIPNGYIAAIYCDGTDCYNRAPQLFSGPLTIAGQLHGLTAGSAATDAVNKTQMETAIATAGLPATGGTVLIDLNDTTAGYPATKIVATASGGLSASVANLGGNETLTFAMDVNGMNTAAAVDPAADYVPMYDASVAAMKKVLVTNIADEGQLCLAAGVFAL